MGDVVNISKTKRYRTMDGRTYVLPLCYLFTPTLLSSGGPRDAASNAGPWAEWENRGGRVGLGTEVPSAVLQGRSLGRDSRGRSPPEAETLWLQCILQVNFPCHFGVISCTIHARFYSASAWLAMQSAVLARGILSVRLSVLPSRSGIVSRRMKIRSCGFQLLVGQSL